MITSVLDDNGYLVDDHAAAVKTTVTKHKKTFYEIPKGLENGDICKKATEVKETNSNGDNVSATTEYYTVSDNDEDLLQLIRENMVQQITYMNQEVNIQKTEDLNRAIWL